jgi:TolB protein
MIKYSLKFLFLALAVFLTACTTKKQYTKDEALETAPYVIAYSSKETGDAEIYLSDSKAKVKTRITTRPGRDGYIAWSPDGARIASYAYYDGGNTWSIHTMNRDGTDMKRLTQEKNKWDSSPTWSPDGEKIAFARGYQGAGEDWKAELWIMNSDGSEETQIKALSGGGPYFTQDGKLLFHSTYQSTDEEICIADIDGKNIKKLTNNTAKDFHPELSADAKQIVFMSNRDGNFEIYVMNIDGSNQKRLTFNDVDDWDPSWSADGSKILFQSSDENEKTHVYVMNNDGSSIEKLIDNAFGAVWFKQRN